MMKKILYLQFSDDLLGTQIEVRLVREEMVQIELLPRVIISPRGTTVDAPLPNKNTI